MGWRKKIYLAVVIAAKSDEHLQVLQILTRALMHDVSEQVKNASKPEQIIELLQAQPLSLHFMKTSFKLKLMRKISKTYFGQLLRH